MGVTIRATPILVKTIKMYSYRVLASISFFFLFSSQAFSQFALCDDPKVELVIDLDTSYATPYIYTERIIYENTLYYSFHDGVHGVELWKSDGYDGTAVMVADLYEGVLSSAPSDFVIMSKTLFFAATTKSLGRELWSLDLTERNAVPTLIANIGKDGDSSSPDLLTYDGKGLIYFSAYQPERGKELWKTDGTTRGTRFVKDIYEGSQSSDIKHITMSNGICFFSANDGISGQELWRSDGTESGTEIVKNLNSQSSHSFPEGLIDYNGTLIFSADSPVGREPWKSDGTESGTRRIKDIACPSTGSVVQNENNTNLKKDTNYKSFRCGSNPKEFTIYNDMVYFTAQQSNSSSATLWRTDGTEAGTVEVTSFPTNPINLVVANSKLFFSRKQSFNPNKDLYVTDGTPSGTEELYTGSNIQLLSEYSNSLYFSASGPDGIELYKSDGSISGTSQEHDIQPGSLSSSPQNGFSGESFFFFAHTQSSGYELYNISSNNILSSMGDRSSLSFTGSSQISNPIIEDDLIVFSNSEEDVSSSFIIRNDELKKASYQNDPLFEEYDVNHFVFQDLLFSHHPLFNIIYKYDEINNEFIEFDNLENNTHLFYAASLPHQLLLFLSSNSEVKIWSTDGTSSLELIGTFGGFENSPSIYEDRFENPFLFRNELYFFGKDFDDKNYLWKTDGESVTKLDQIGLPDNFDLEFSSTLDNYIVLLIRDQINFDNQLWFTDGTSDGTYNICGSVSGLDCSEIDDHNLISTGSHLYFEMGNFVWRTDGDNTQFLYEQPPSGQGLGTMQKFSKNIIAPTHQDSILFIDNLTGQVDVQFADYDVNKFEENEIWGQLFLEKFMKGSSYNEPVPEFNILDISTFSLTPITELNDAFYYGPIQDNISSSFYKSRADEIYFIEDDGISGEELWRISCRCAPSLSIDNYCLDPGTYISSGSIELKGASTSSSSVLFEAENEINIFEDFEIKANTQATLITGDARCSQPK